MIVATKDDVEYTLPYSVIKNVSLSRKSSDLSNLPHLEILHQKNIHWELKIGPGLGIVAGGVLISKTIRFAGD